MYYFDDAYAQLTDAQVGRLFRLDRKQSVSSIRQDDPPTNVIDPFPYVRLWTVADNRAWHMLARGVMRSD